MNSLSKYASELVPEAKLYFKEALRNSSEKNFHLLRVSIKKIYALISFLSFSMEIPFEVNKKMEKLFKRVGNIREKQLLIDLLKKHLSIPEMKKKAFVRKLENELKNKSKDLIDRYTDKEDDVFEETKILIDKLLALNFINDSKAYYRLMAEKILSNRKQLSDNEKHVHDLRKNIKELKYNLKFDDDTQVPVISIQKLLTWEKILGEWHDAVVFASKIEKYIQQTRPGSDLYYELIRMQKSSLDHSKVLLKSFRI